MRGSRLLWAAALGLLLLTATVAVPFGGTPAPKRNAPPQPPPPACCTCQPACSCTTDQPAPAPQTSLHLCAALPHLSNACGSLEARLSTPTSRCCTYIGAAAMERAPLSYSARQSAKWGPLLWQGKVKRVRSGRGGVERGWVEAVGQRQMLARMHNIAFVWLRQDQTTRHHQKVGCANNSAGICYSCTGSRRLTGFHSRWQ